MKKLLFIVLFCLVAVNLYAAPSIPKMSPLPTPDSTVHRTPVIMMWPVTPTWVDAVYCSSANVAVSYTIPSWANFVMINGSAIFYANFEGTAAIPAAAVTDGSAPFIWPQLVPVTGGASISFIAPTAGTIITIAPIK